MNADTNKEKLEIPAGNRPVDAGQLKCPGFQALKNWQVERYQQAVNENRWYMSQRHGRWVDWKEAEQDFLMQGCYGCAELWRQEYCVEICPYKSSCLLALCMVKEVERVPLPKTG